MNSLRLMLSLILTVAMFDSASAALKLPAKRPAWTTSRIIGSPNPPAPYRVEVAFPGLTFKNPVEMMPEPGADRFYLTELNGKVFRFDNRADAKAVEIADLKRELSRFLRILGFQFDPGFRQNRQVYVCYNTANKTPDGSRISRFTLTDSEPPRLDPASEEVIVKWVSGGHNGCSMHFGPEDGYLYFSTGDAEVPTPPDPLSTGQNIGDLLGSIQRIDVHQTAGGKNYLVPTDNPFVKTPGARPEVWAYGLRNPWRMSFDDDTKRLLVGDVGWELWEMIYDVRKGGNYGWSITEGPQLVKPDQPPGPTPILKPLISHSHVEAMSITGGYTYRGQRLPGLYNQWIYGDYVTGKLWSFTPAAAGMKNHRELLDSHLRVITFARDHSGEVFIVDYAGQIYRFAKNDRQASNTAFPQRLSETGLFQNLPQQVPAPGVIPYAIQAEPWMDGATARRFLAIPGDGQLDYHKRNNAAYGMMRDFFEFPTNTVLAKTISLGQPKRPIETQILHFNGEGWHPYNYLWNEDQTEAHLADGLGSDLKIPTSHSKTRPWRIHSNTECMTCHMSRPGFVLGMHHQFTDLTTAINGRNQNQQDAWIGMGLLTKRPKVQHWLKKEPELQRRARAHLHVNCAHCHRQGGGGSAPFELRADLPPERMKLFRVKPNQGTFGMVNPSIVVPGDPDRSVLLYRLASTGGAHMPKLGPRTIDADGLKLTWDWIASLRPGHPPEKEVRPPELYENTAQSLRYAIQLDQFARVTTGHLPKPELMPPHIYDLLERFLPEDRKRKTVGATADAAAILALTGHAGNGRKLFHLPERTQCINCHKLGDQGKEVGPDLSHIGSKYNRAQLLQSLVQPSSFIDPRYRAVSIETKADESFTGFIVSRPNGNTLLRDLTGKDHTFKPYMIATTTYGKLSLMPEGLIQGLTPQEAADLLAFLATLK
jgi:putative heme-binding domain-containing protein